MSATRLHDRWRDMMRRCYDARFPDYKRYGKRGIKVCDEWHGFTAFCDWFMEHIVQVPAEERDKMTVDRIDNDGDYSPANCRLVSRKVQANNTRATKRVRFCGKTYTLSEFAETIGVSKQLLYVKYFFSVKQKQKTIDIEPIDLVSYLAKSKRRTKN